VPLSPALARVRREAVARIDTNADRAGIDRRVFLGTTCASATVLLGLNSLGCGGGRYRLPPEAAHEGAAAADVLEGDEFIFDVQTHLVAGDRPWWRAEEPNLGDFLRTRPSAQCGEPDWVQCFTEDPFIKEVFLDSDTKMAVLSALWGDLEANPLLVQEAARARDRIAKMEGAPRLRIHGIVEPNARSPELTDEAMPALAEAWDVAAWKLYPVWGPDGEGYRLTDELAARVFERGLSLGKNRFAIHKGLPLPGMAPDYTSPLDVGPAAKAYPDAVLLIYHSGYESDRREGPYDPNADRGVDALIRSLHESGIGKDGNVYAELGSLWRNVMTDPDQAAHVLGKLLTHVGEDRILWGTDSIWYGSPQDQIQAFRAFEITPEFQERYGYPALTPVAKAKIFGLNAARVYDVDPDEMRRALAWDALAKARRVYEQAPSPSFRTYGPRTRRELFAFLRAERGG
jgi:predicted TIM-barrel fold metal-dependent hydrolase